MASSRLPEGEHPTLKIVVDALRTRPAIMIGDKIPVRLERKRR